ncbi:proteinase inhibitor PSI-1.2-like [Lycium ferocissimum]|uniref:proteinase inhibitor PSI-1.2-like n=1 Tax=Lycium ferocissimum TaxID=112874 RepID=UPI002815CB3E|nr:proteinase inhibitor PSI-1.2-like [Lycium ferocissimum]
MVFAQSSNSRESNMAIHKVGFLALLLLCGTLVLGGKVATADEKSCPRNCINDAAYMICPTRHGRHKLIESYCDNCCTLPENCKLFKENGDLICTGTDY